MSTPDVIPVDQLVTEPYKLFPVADNQLRLSWPWIREGLIVLLKKNPEPWIPEDVYSSVKERKAVIYIAAKNNQPVGFVVVKSMNKNLHIWCAYSVENDPELIDYAWKQLVEIAKQTNHANITFESNRPGWQQKAEAMGFVPRSWTRPVDSGE